MPFVTKRINKEGKVTSYRLGAYAGQNEDGESYKVWKKWVPPKKNLSPEQIEKLAYAEAVKFEDEVRGGYIADNRTTFREYAERVLEIKLRAGASLKTIDRYRSMLRRINRAIGNMKLAQIKPQHLNDFYANISMEGLREDNNKVVATDYLIDELIRNRVKASDISKKTRLSRDTVRKIKERKPIATASANKLCDKYGFDPVKCFTSVQGKRKLSDKTILEHHRLIHTILAHAVKERILMNNAADGATPPKYIRPEPDYFQIDEMKAIITALQKAPLKWKALTYFLMDTGCRRGEVVGLKWKNVNLDHHIAKIESELISTPSKGVYESPTKTRKTRFIKFSDTTAEVLLTLKKIQDHNRKLFGNKWVETGYVFTQDNGDRMHPDSVTGWLADFSKKNGLPHIHPHAFRHTAASLMIANGVDLVTAAAELGHANANTTAAIYAHQIAEQRALSADVRGSIFTVINE